MNVMLIALLLIGTVGSLLSGSDVPGALGRGTAAAVDAAVRVSGAYLLWMGLLHVAEEAGLLRALSKALRPALSLLFPGANGAEEAISMNLAANMLGMGNAATPCGLSAMRIMNDSNPHPGVATDAMCVLLCVNASCLELYPATLVGLRQSYGSAMPYAVVLPTLLASLCSTAVAVTLCLLLTRPCSRRS